MLIYIGSLTKAGVSKTITAFFAGLLDTIIKKSRLRILL